MASVEQNIERLDRKLEQLIAKMDAALNRAERRLLLDLGEAVGRRETRAALNVAGEFEQEIERKGLAELLDSVSELYGNITGQVRDAFRDSAISFDFSRSEIASVALQTQADLDIIGSLVDSYLANVKSNILRTTFAGGDTADIEAIIDTEHERLLRALETNAINALQGFRNAITFRKAKEAKVERLKYAGPKDDKNRPFCKKNVGKIFTLDEVKALRNDNGNPALTDMGGYNCRHEWRPVK